MPLNADADEVVLGPVAAARMVGNGKIGHLALSFGGNYSALTGLSGVVDAAVDDGGPVKDSFTAENLGRHRGERPCEEDLALTQVGQL